MTVLPSLPTFDLYIGFYQQSATTPGPLIEYAATYPLPASGASNTQWTNASQYLLSHSLSFGKQHYLDRAEPATATIVLNARDGFFFNGTLNGQGVILSRQMPIAITATVGGTQHPVYVGFVQQVHEQPIDVLNDVVTVDAVDFTGLLAITEATNPNLYSTYANSTYAQNWYRMGVPLTVNILSAFNYVPSWISGVTVASNQVLYTVSGTNNMSVGEKVTTAGLAGVGLNTNSLCYSNMTVAQVVGQYIVCTLASGTTPSGSVSSQGTGTMYWMIVYDQIGTGDGTIEGLVSWPNQGALVYDPISCVDLGAGGFGTQSGYLSFAVPTAAGAECWFLGLNAVGQTIIGMGNSATAIYLDLQVDGTLILVVGSTVYQGSAVSVTDGYWHHVGLFIISGSVYIYCDGIFTLTSYSPGVTTFSTDPGTGAMLIGYSTSGELLGAYIAEPLFSAAGVTANEVKERYVVGNLCQKTKYSGDRIAELLFIAGFGSVNVSTLGIATPTNYFNIGTSYGVTSDYNSVAGSAGASQVEPYYWDTPIHGSMIMDLINQSTTTDYGVFIQLPSGEFLFFTQNWFGTWAYTENVRTQKPTSYSWTPNSSAWAAAPTLSDDGTGIPYVSSALDILADGADSFTHVAIDPQAGQRQVIELSPSATLKWGSSTMMVSSNLPTSLKQARSLGYYLAYLFRPGTLLRRVDSVTTGTEQGNGANNATLLALTVWQVVFFKRTPPNASVSGQINKAMAIEKMKMEFDSQAGYVHWTFGLSPYEVQ